MTNLLQNAVEAMPYGGWIDVSCALDGDVSIIIADEGHGIPDGIKDRIFLPFFTTKERGTGLGLSLVHNIVVSHGGSIHVESREKGTSFAIRLPCVERIVSPAAVRVKIRTFRY